MNATKKHAELPQGDDWVEAREEDITEISDCFCPCCSGGNATTIMLPTKIPLFREIIVMSLSCPDCNFRNSEVSFGGEIQERGQRIEFTLTSPQDLNRQIVKSDSALLLIPRLQFEIPASTQRGTISTLEGMLKRAADNLAEIQPERLRLGDVDNFHRCQHVIQELRRVIARDERKCDDDDDDKDKAKEPFPLQIILDDPAGNSFIENPNAPKPDPNMTSITYYRTATQDMALGLQPASQAVQMGRIDDAIPAHKNPVNVSQDSHTVQIDSRRSIDDEVTDSNFARHEVMKFSTPCPHCHENAETDMCMTDIPHFKEVVIMSLLCEHCGYRSNEIKGGGAIPQFGTKITLRVLSEDDLAREVLKSDTAGVEIPELELALEEGGLEGVYTTVEGLLVKVHERLKSVNPFGSGDAAMKHHLDNDGGAFSAPSQIHVRYKAFLDKLQHFVDGRAFPFTLVISDPLSNSFVGPIPKDAVALSLKAKNDRHHGCYDSYVDQGMDIEEYERTNDQNEILGLNDINTENYQVADTEDRMGKVYWGTDKPQHLPDGLRRVYVRGPDHPHIVGKAPVEGDITGMGAASKTFAIPEVGQRGRSLDGVSKP